MSPTVKQFGAILVAGVALAMVSVACRTEDGQKVGEPQSGSATRVPPESAEPFSLRWETVAGSFNSYRLDAPADWMIEDERLPGGFMQRYVLMNGTERVVQFAVRCAVGMSVADMMWQDSQIVSSLDGTFGVGGARQVSVAGLTGTSVDYTLNFGGVPVEQRAVYLESPPCGWRLVLQAFGSGVKERYQPVFDRMLSSFVPLVFDVPFTDRDPYVPR